MEKNHKREIVLSVIHSRKSVRSFVHNKPVSKEDLLELAKAGMAGPSGKNAQPWEIIIVNEKELIKKIAETTPYAEMLIDAGHAIILAANLNKEYKETPNLWVQDLSAASENILIAAEAMGFGAVWCGVYPTEDRIKGIKDVLKLPDHIIAFNIISIGYPTGYEQPQEKWNKNKLHLNGW